MLLASLCSFLSYSSFYSAPAQTPLQSTLRSGRTGSECRRLYSNKTVCDAQVTGTFHEHYKVERIDCAGSGEAGKCLAWTLAKKGMRAVVIERKCVGGSCPNITCLPSKNFILSAKVASYFWRSGEFGINEENTQINMSGVRDSPWRLGATEFKPSLRGQAAQLGRLRSLSLLSLSTTCSP